MQEDLAIVVRNLTKSFQKLHVLKGVDFVVPQGTMLALLGPNGAGKTTIVRILSTLLKPDSGEAFIGGFDVVKHPAHVRRLIGLTGQYAAVDEILNGRENLEMMGRLYHLTKRESIERAKELLRDFDLEEAAERVVKTYSGGMRRRLDLAASLVAKPPIIFLDEPTTGLDPRARAGMWDVIKNLLKSGATILLTTQYMEEADQLADRIVVIDRGTVIAEGTGNELKANIGSERLEVVIAQESDFGAAVKLFDTRAQVDEDLRSITITTDGSVHEVRTALESLDRAGIDIDTLSLHKPTLDDVFLQLTGHETEQEEEERETTHTA
jgi:ABC-2 type transport system ATP-binding protein